MESLHKEIGDEEYPEWFTGGKSCLLLKPDEFSSQNQRPITCLNNLYKVCNSCLLSPMDKHLEEHYLLEGEQRGAKSMCSGTTDNLLVYRVTKITFPPTQHTVSFETNSPMVYRMVCQDSRNSRKVVKMAWIDARKVFDSVSHEWLLEMMLLHKFPSWLCNGITRLCQSWNTKITIRTRQGMETFDFIHFNKGLLQGDVLCPRLFTLF